MYRYFGEYWSYDLFNMLSYYALLFSTLFFFKLKRQNIGLYAKYISFLASRKKNKLGTVVEYLFAFVETFIIAYMIDYCSAFNRPFGEIVGTGSNYFAELIAIPVLCTAQALIICANPLKQLDIATLMAPIQLLFFKLACFFNGCCWGIEWEYGLYNHHPSHPGRQVPTQAIEILFAIIIFIILFFYKNKAKTGTIFPMYMILYGGTRFFVEFLKAGYPNVLGPFKVYHILCFICFVVGIILFFVARKFGDKFSDFFEKLYSKLDTAIAMKKALKEQLIAEENIKREADMQERLEKAKLARAKASVKYRK